jgi:flavin-dependent dehydrogenase
MAEAIDTVIVGAGHAGLAESYYLTRHGIEHVVLERGQVRSDGVQSDGIPSSFSSQIGRCNCQAMPIKVSTAAQNGASVAP